ncbi:hypothetical protein Tco_1468197 [Tanacetum coccineum]
MDVDEVSEMDPYEEDEEDPDEDPVDYPADGGDDDDDESSDDDDDDDDDDVEEDKEEEHLAPADSTVVASPAIDLVPFAEETEPFESDESAATPPPPPPPPAYRTTARMSIQSQEPIPCTDISKITKKSVKNRQARTRESEEYKKKPRIQNQSQKSQTRSQVQAAGIQLRAASPLPLSTPSTSRGADIPKADIPPQKRLLLTAPTPRFKVGESSAAAAKQPGSTVARRVDYSFVDIVDASIRASERRTMAAIEMVNLRERVEARQALARSKAYNRALEARIAVLETRVHRHEWQCQDADDHATGAMMRIQVLEARARIDSLEDTSSSA